MTGLKENSESPPPTDASKRTGWNARLMEALGNFETLARISREARNEIISTELLSRPFQRNTVSSTKMAGAGDDPIGF